MVRVIGLSFVFATLTLLVGRAQAAMLDQNIIVSHSGLNDPETESPAWVLDDGSNPGVVSSGPGTEIIGGTSYDYWFTDDSGSGSGQFIRYSTPVSASDATNAWTLRARARSVGTSSIDQQFRLHDGTHRWDIWIEDTVIRHTLSGGITLLDTLDATTDYREYELLYQPTIPGVKSSTDTLSIYVDQSFLTSITRADTFAIVSATEVFFGGNSSSGTGRVNWAQIEFAEGAILGFAQSIPEPSSGLMLLGGVFALIRRQRRGRASCVNRLK